MSGQFIEYIIDTDGTTTITGQGFKGGACSKHIEAAEKPFVSTIGKKEQTAEFYEAQPQAKLETKRGGGSGS